MNSLLLKPSIALVAALFSLTACSQKQDDITLSDDKIIQKGQQAALALKTTLIGPLQAAMKSGGPLAALPMCKSSAPALSKSASEQLDGISIKRISSRPRNPDNSPDEIDREVLKIFELAESENAPIPTHHIKHIASSKQQAAMVRYYEPLMIKKLCLNCHGDKSAMDPNLVELLKKLYPEDLATSYKEGDFRGLIRVDIKETH